MVLGDSVEGRQLYYGQVGESGLRLIAREIETGTEREITTLSGDNQSRGVAGFWNPQMSPDGRYVIASVANEGRRTLIAVAVSSGQRREIATGDDYVLMWAPDSRSIFVRRGAGASARVVRVSVDAGETSAVEWSLGADNHSFRLQPDGRRILYVVSTSSETSQVRRLTGIVSQLQEPDKQRQK